MKPRAALDDDVQASVVEPLEHLRDEREGPDLAHAGLTIVSGMAQNETSLDPRR